MYLKPTLSSKCRDLLLFILTFCQHFLLCLVRTQLCLSLDKIFCSNKHRCIQQWFFFSHCVVWKSMSTTRQLTPTGVEIQKRPPTCVLTVKVMIIQGRQCDERIQFIYFIYKVLVVLRRVDQNSRLRQNGPVQNLNISVTNFFFWLSFWNWVICIF